MRFVHHVTATFLGGVLALVTLLSLMALGPRWENNPTLGRLLTAMSVTGTYWVLLMLLRRHTGLLPSSAKYAMFAAACLTWAVIYVSVKAPDDPPVFALLGPVIWLPGLLLYRLPFNVKSKRSTLD